MTRGILALLTFAATLFTQPAPAAEAPLTAYEITRRYPGGPRDVTVHAFATSLGEPAIMAFIQLAPRKGGGWTRTKFALVMFNNTDTRFTAYGGPAPAPVLPCPAAGGVCGVAGEDMEVYRRYTFRPAAGNRYFLVGPTDRTTVIVPGWDVRQAAIAARVVTGPGESADAVGAVANGSRHEAFVSATAPGGKYGSAVFAMVPCDGPPDSSVGTATVKSDGTDAAAAISCKPGGWYAVFSGTLDGRKWTLTGPVVGETNFPFRLFVIDYPKR